MAKGKLALGLDIGSSGVKLIQLKEQRRRGEVTYSLQSFGMKPLPPEAIVDGALMNSTAIVQAILSFISPYSVLSPVLDALTRSFYKPFRRVIPPLGGIDLSPLFLVLAAQIAIMLLRQLKMMAVAPF